jgi:predicted small lipoprotein YifL
MKKFNFVSLISKRLAIFAAIFVLSVSALTACGGGGGSALPKPSGQNPPPANQQQFGSVEGRLTDSGLSLRGASQVSGSGDNAPPPRRNSRACQQGDGHLSR